MANQRTGRDRLKNFGAFLAALVAALAAMSQFMGVSVKDVYETMVPPKKEGCVVLDYRGKDAVMARVSVTNLGLVPVIKNEKNDNYKIGTVIAQEPTPNSILKECQGEVYLLVSADEQTVAETPEERPTPLSESKGNNKVNVGRALSIVALIVGFFYMIYRATDLF